MKQIKTMTTIILNYVLLAIEMQGAQACKGYTAKLLMLQNCAGRGAIINFHQEFSVKLNINCEIIFTGCVVNKGFTTAIGTYKFAKSSKENMLAVGRTNLCSMHSHVPVEVADYLKLFGGLSSCPTQEGKICGNETKIDLSQYMYVLSVDRTYIVIDFKIEHDTGESCVHAEMEISRI